MERRKIIFEDQARKALLDGMLDESEKKILKYLETVWNVKTPRWRISCLSKKYAFEGKI